MRDLDQAFTHIHDQEIEISERFYLDPLSQFARECPLIALRCRDLQRGFSCELSPAG
jgi:hypothetical protein